MTHAYCGQQSLGNIGADDTNEERNGDNPRVSQRYCYHEEQNAHENGDEDDDVDKMSHLSGERGRTEADVRRQAGNATHDRLITGADHDTCRCTCKRQVNEIYSSQLYLHLCKSN